MAGEDFAQLNIIVESDQVDKASRRLDQLSGSAKKAEDSSKRFSREAEQVSSRMREQTRIADQLAGVMKTLITLYSVRKIVEMADQYKLLESRLKQVTANSRELAAVEARLVQISQNTRSSLEGTITLYSRVARVRGQLNASQDDVLRFTEITQKAILVSGASTQEAAAGVQQLAQALASGRLQGDEFRSIMENLGGVALQLAEGLGVTVGQLRQMSAEGKLTSDLIFNTLLKRGAEVEALFKQIPLTVGQSFVVLQNALTIFVGKSEDVARVTRAMADAVKFVADNVSYFTAALEALSIVLITMYVRSVVAATGATALFTLALKAIGIGLVIAGLTYLIERYGGLSNAIQVAAEYLKMFAILMANFGISAVNTGKAILGGFAGAFNHIGEIFSAFTEDLREFIENPFGDNAGFNNLSAVLSKGFAGAFKESYDIVKASAKDDTAQISKDLEAIFSESYQRIENIKEAAKDAGKTPGAYDLFEKPENSGSSAAVVDAAAAKKIAKQKEYVTELMNTVTQLEKYKEALQVSEAAGESLLTQMEAENEVRKQGLDLTTKEGKAALDLVKKRAALEESVKTITDAYDEEAEKRKQNIAAAQQAMLQPFENATREIQASLSGMFQNIYDGGINSFSDLARSVKGIFTKLAAELTTILVFQPQLSGLASGGGLASLFLGGSAGNSPGAGAASTFSSLNSLSSIGSAIAKGLNTSILSPTSSIGAGLDSIGAALGLGKGANFVGPTLPGTAPGSISGAFTPGNALGGIAGSMLADALLGQRGIGASIGGGLGGIGGAVVGGNLLAPLLGSFGGPVGALAGAFLGNAVGGLFGGNSRPHPASNFGSSGIDAAGNITDSVFSSKHTDTKFAEALSTSLSQVTKTLVASGLDLTNFTSIQGGQDDGRGFFSIGNFKDFRKGETVTFDPTSETGTQKGLADFAKLLVLNARNVGDVLDEELSGALQKISTDGKTAEEALNQISFLLTFKDLGKTKETVSETQVVFDQLTKTFADAKQTAMDLGLSTAKLTQLEKARQEAFNQLVSGFNNSVYRDILSGTGKEGIGKLLDEQKRYQQQLKDAQTIGADLQAVELLHKKNVLSIQQEINQQEQQTLNTRLAEAKSAASLWENLVRTIDNSVNSLRLSESTSPLGLGSRLQEAQRLFNDAVNRAQGGDTQAATDATQLGQTVAELAKQFYGGTTAFTSIEAQVEQRLADLREYATSQLSEQQQIVNNTQRQISTLQDGFSTLDASLQQIADLLIRSVGGNLTGSGLPNSSLTFNELVGQNEAAIRSAGKYDEFEYIRSITAPGVTPGNGAVSNYYRANPSADANARALAKQYGIPGFALGTENTGSRPFMAGENGPELIFPNSSGGFKVTSNSETRALASNDTKKIKQMETQLREQEKRNRKREEQLLLQLSTLNNSFQELSSALRRRA